MFSITKNLMRIGIITSSYPLSTIDTVNAGIFVCDIAQELARRGHQVYVLTPHKHGRVETSVNVTLEFIPWLGGEKDLASLSMKNPLNLLRFGTLVISGLWKVDQFVRANRLDIMLAMWAIPSGLFSWWAWRWRGIPYGVWALGSDIWARGKYPFGDRIVRRVLKNAQFRFADGVQLAGDVEKLANRPCSFVPSVRQLPASDSNLIDPQLTPGAIHFLFIGRYERNKGPDILVESMRELLDGGETAHLHMFGDGSLMPHLKMRIQGYEQNIHLHGYADPNTVMAFMRSCDRLIIPSRVESIPLIFADAMQMRLPVIAADVGDLGTLVRRFGVGKVVPPNDPKALAAEMRAAHSKSLENHNLSWDAPLELFNLQGSVLKVEEAMEGARDKIA